MFYADISPSCSHLVLDKSAGTSKEHATLQLQVSVVVVAVASKLCHLRQSEVGLLGYNFLQWVNKKAPAAWAEAR